MFWCMRPGSRAASPCPDRSWGSNLPEWHSGGQGFESPQLHSSYGDEQVLIVPFRCLLVLVSPCSLHDWKKGDEGERPGQGTSISPVRTSVGRSFDSGGVFVRRPHPRFDEARNAWVTRAGGKLKILARGPKNAETEAAAWGAFYPYMTGLGRLAEGPSAPAITL